MAIISVKGTIYGQETNFTRDSTTGKWVGTITIPDHAGYTNEIDLVATNSDGEIASNNQEKVYIFILLSFITDRSVEDVQHVQELIRKFYDGTITADELVEWQTDLKGTLNKSDINRIYSNWTLAINNYFSKLYEADSTTYTDYTDDISDILDLTTEQLPLKEDFESLLTHLQLLENWANVNELLEYDVPAPPNMPLNNLTSWNTIENIIERIYLRTIDHHI